MNTDRLLAAGIALCCIFAIGTSASTLGASVHTNPDDVINVNYKSLPINPTDAGELKREAQSKGSPTASQSKKQKKQQQAQQQQQQKQQQQSQQNQQKKQSSASNQDKQSDQNSPPEKPDLLAKLLALLRKLMRLLVWIVPIAILVGGVAVGVRFRDRLFGDGSEEKTTVPEPTPPPAPDPNPSNEIERTWWAMVERFGVEQPHTKTPGECAREAISAGGDEDAVQTVTRTFEEVRYGGAPITDDRIDRIQHGSDRLGVQQ